MDADVHRPPPPPTPSVSGPGPVILPRPIIKPIPVPQSKLSSCQVKDDTENAGQQLRGALGQLFQDVSNPGEPTPANNPQRTLSQSDAVYRRQLDAADRDVDIDARKMRRGRRA